METICFSMCGVTLLSFGFMLGWWITDKSRIVGRNAVVSLSCHLDEKPYAFQQKNSDLSTL